MLLDFAADVEEVFTIDALDWLIIEGSLLFLETFDVKGHASDWARTFYAFARGDTNHVVLSTLKQKVFVTGVSAFRTFVALLCAWLLLYRSHHIPER